MPCARLSPGLTLSPYPPRLDFRLRLHVHVHARLRLHAHLRLRLLVAPHPSHCESKALCDTKLFVSDEQSVKNQPLDAAAARQIIADQTSASAQRLEYDDRRAYLVWGFAYLVGYGLLALSIGPQAPTALLPAIAYAGFATCIGGGMVYSVVTAIRTARGMRGASATRVMLYGYAWCFAFVPTSGFSYRLGTLPIDENQFGMLINSICMLLVGVLFMAGGAIWRDVTQYVIGAIIAAAVAVALIAGFPAYYWIMCLGIGGLLIVAALIHRPIQRAVQARRARADA